MATITWVVFKHHKKADGTFNPKIRVYHNGTSAYMSTPVYTQFVRFKRGESMGTIKEGAIVDMLNDRVKMIRNIVNACPMIDEIDNAKSLVDYIDRKLNMDKELDYLAFLESCINSAKNNGGKSVKQSLLANLSAYTSGKLPVRKITPSFLKMFEMWMLSERPIRRMGKVRNIPPASPSTIRSYMEAFQAVFNKMKAAYNNYELGDIVIPGEPFKVYKPQGGCTFKKKAVDVGTIRLIAAYQPNKKASFQRVLARDMFLLSFGLAGMNLIDFVNCSIYSDGRIFYERTKTKDRKKDGAFISVPVMPEIQPLFDAYRDESGDKVFRLGKMFNSMGSFRTSVAMGMKLMCKDLGIEPITFYAARHSFATLARNECEVSMEDIALCLTHRSVFNMTDTYVKPDFSRVDRVIRKVLDLVFHPDKV